jgi:hypothetical protein
MDRQSLHEPTGRDIHHAVMWPSENHPSRDCLETLNGLYFISYEPAQLGEKVLPSALRATKKRAIRPLQLLSRQSLHALG